MILSRLAIGPRFNKKLFLENGWCSFIFEFRELELFKPVGTFQG